MPNSRELALAFGRDPVGASTAATARDEIDVGARRWRRAARGSASTIISVAGQPEYVGVTSTRNRPPCHRHVAHDAELDDRDRPGSPDRERRRAHPTADVERRAAGRAGCRRGDARRCRGRPSPLRARVGALQELHLGEQMAEVLGVHALLAAAAARSMHPFAGRQRERRFVERPRERRRATGRAARADPAATPASRKRGVDGIRREQLARCTATGDRAPSACARATRRCRRRGGSPSRRCARRGRRLPSRAFAAISAMRASVERVERAQQQQMRVVEVELPRHRVAKSPFGQLDQLHVAKRVAVAQERELVLARGPRALDLARVARATAALAEQVEADVGQRDVFLEDRAVPDPLAQPLREDDVVVAEAQQVFELALASHASRSQSASLRPASGRTSDAGRP